LAQHKYSGGLDPRSRTEAMACVVGNLTVVEGIGIFVGQHISNETCFD
jgi:hypothetical protein